jgi:hypothetical protein
MTEDGPLVTVQESYLHPTDSIALASRKRPASVRADDALTALHAHVDL